MVVVAAVQGWNAWVPQWEKVEAVVVRGGRPTPGRTDPTPCSLTSSSPVTLKPGRPWGLA